MTTSTTVARREESAPVADLVTRWGGHAVLTALPDIYSPQQLEEMPAERLRALVLNMQRRDQIAAIRLAENGAAVRQIRTRVHLRMGYELCQFGKVLPFINARGWLKINAVAGIQLILARSVLVDGVERANPWYASNPKTGAIEAIYVRKVGVGRNALGNWIARDHTVIYLPGEYLLEDLHNKERENRAAIQGHVRQEGAAVPEGRFYLPEVFAPDGGSSMGMLIDPANGDVRDTLKMLAQRRKKAIQIANTHCDRDIIKKMTGIADPIPNGAGDAWVMVTGWVEDDQVVRALWKLAEGEGQIEAQLERAGIVDAEVETTTETAAPEETDPDLAAGDAEEDEDDQPPSVTTRGTDAAALAETEPASGPAAPPPPPPPPPAVDTNGQAGLALGPTPVPAAAPPAGDRLAALEAMRAKIRAIAEEIGPDEFAAACSTAGVNRDAWEQAAPRALGRLHEAMAAALDDWRAEV